MDIFTRRFAPTPLIWRVMGGAILYGCNLASVEQILKDNQYISIFLILAGMIGHFLSNLPVDTTLVKNPDA